MSKNAQHAKDMYDRGLWGKKILRNLTKKGYITPADYEAITGDVFEE